MAGFKLAAGSTVSHFRLEKKLGEGGMGSVYLAEDLTLSRQVAIKFMSRSEIAQQGDDKLVANLEQRFIREAKSAAAINHPNVCQIYEANFETENWFIAMELIGGKALSELLEEGKTFSGAEVVQILMQAVSGLKFAWDHYNIVHRDIKPQNIMLTSDGQVKIVDLGLAKPVAANDPDYEMPELTGAGVPIGTPQYMAPEQAAGETDIDHRADIFALGVTVYELLTGKKAFTQKTAPMIYIAQMKRDYTPIGELRTGLPQGLVDLVDELLAPNKSERLGDYQTLLQKLGSLGASMSLPGSGTSQFVTQSGTIPLAGAARAQDADTYPIDHLIINRYKVVNHLGRSRAGIVYLCIDLETKRDCAVKSLLPDREFPAQSMGLIQKNFQRLREMDHPNLVTIHDVHLEPEKGELLVVMDLLRGQNLRQWTHHEITRYGELDVAKIAPVVQLVAQALDSVGAKFKLGHGDIKPESIYLVDNDSRVVLLDYGVTEDPGAGRIVDGEQVRTPLPSPDYMAPELWRGEPLSRTCDQYSLGVTIYEMLSSHLPFWLKDQGTTTTRLGASELASEKDLLRKMSQRVLAEPPPPIDELPELQMQALNQALSKQGNDRYESCAALAKALTVSASSSKGKQPLIFAAMGVVGLVLVGVIAVLLLQPAEAPPAPPEPGDSAVSVPAVGLSPEQLKAKQQASSRQATFIGKFAALRGLSGAEEEVAAIEALQARAEAALAADDYQTAVELYEKALQAIDAAAIKLDKQAREQAAELASRFATVYARLAANPLAQEKLSTIDGQRLEAEQAFNDEQYVVAAQLYQTAIASTEAALEELSRLMREKAVRSRTTFEAAWRRLQAATDRDALLQPVSKARQTAMEAMAREEFATAIAAYETAGKELEQAMAKVQDLIRAEAAAQRQTFVKAYEALSEREEAAPLLPALDNHKIEAEAAFAGERFKEAVTHYQAGLAAVEAAQQQLTDAAHVREQTTALQTIQRELAAEREVVNALAGLDAQIDTLLDKLDQVMALGEEALLQQKFAAAQGHFKRARELFEQARTRSQIFEPTAGEDFTAAGFRMELVWLPELKFWAGKYEVTNRQYRIYKNDHVTKVPEHVANKGYRVTMMNGDQQPVCWVPQTDAVAYCELMNGRLRELGFLPEGYEFRLPTAAEWEAMARCGTGRDFPWGDEWPPTHGNFGNFEVFGNQWKLDGYEDPWPLTCDVSESGKSDWGLYGMAGNVWEWTSTAHPKEAEKRQVFGGSWEAVVPQQLKIDLGGVNFAFRSVDYENIGFRVILAPVPE